MSPTKFGILCITLIAFGVSWLFTILRNQKIPPSHLLHHPIVYQENFIPLSIGTALLQRIKYSLKDFPTNVNDLNFYRTKHEHIGEAIPISVDGSCAHPFLVPNSDRSLCVLPGRIDVGRHYILSGGVEGLKESYTSLVARVQSFGRYHFLSHPNKQTSPETTDNTSTTKDDDIYGDGVPEAHTLFALPAFQTLAETVCPPDKRVLDPFQFNFIINIPGQTVAAHTDAPYFWGADRFHIPQWLLATMVHSNLFAKNFIHQVQVVAYLHQWGRESIIPLNSSSSSSPKGGDFFYWNDATGIPKHVPPVPLSGSAVDGSKVVHAAGVYMPDHKVPVLDKSKINLLRYRDESDTWILYSNDKIIQQYATDDLRISIVYRGRCFENEEEKYRYHQQQRSNRTHDNDMIPLEKILDTFRHDLVQRGVRTHDQLESMKPLDFALLLMDTYIKYPLSTTAIVPVNYCALKLLVPAYLGKLLDYICE